MKSIAIAVSAAALAGTIIPAVMYFFGRADLDAVKLWMLVATAVWFVATPVWLEP